MTLPIFVIYSSLALPLLLFGLTWRRGHSHASKTLIVPTLSAALLLVAVMRDVRVALLGADYSDRLYTIIEINALIALAAAIYFSVTRRWIAGLASLMLAAGWLYMGVVNSAL